MADVVCLLNVESDRATFTWSEGPASFAPYHIEGGLFSDFVDCAGEARDRLSDLVKDYLYDQSNLNQSAFALAEAGHELYLQMFDPGAAQGRNAQEVRTWLESLRASKIIDSLEIVVETPWSMPWNVVYDEEPNREAFLSEDPERTEHWRPFWAIRYNLTGGRRVSPLRRIPLLTDPHVLMVIDPEIRDGLPEDQRGELQAFLDESGYRAIYTKDELVAALKERRPQLLYWLSHATPTALVLNNEEISPRQLRRLLRRDAVDNPYEFGGIAFLNACQTAEAGQGGSFFDALHSVGFSGMVGTEHQTVDTFASPLGVDFLREFLIEGRPLGKVMRRLRARVPLGLLYGTYCPPDLCVEKAAEESHVVIVKAPMRAGAALIAEAGVEVATAQLPEEPYRSLAYYGYADRDLFAGRDEDVERFASLVDDEDTRIIVLHGESGVGKSSFLRAGVIPYLESESIGYRFAREQLNSADGDESLLFVRATNDLAGSLAQTLVKLCSQPFNYRSPLGQDLTVDLPQVLNEVVGACDGAKLRETLLNDPGVAAEIMSKIAEQLPFQLVLVIDQAEEMFTLAQSDDQKNDRQLALAMLSRLANASGRFKVVISLRTEYYGRLIDGLRRSWSETTRLREYLLTDFDESGLVEAMKRPTRRSPTPSGESPHEKYGFSYQSGVAEQIAHQVASFSAKRRDSVLPLLQVICSQLYAVSQQKDDGVIELSDLDAVGGVEGGLRRHVELIIKELCDGSASEQTRLKRLMTRLFLRQPDGSLTTALLREADVAESWTGVLPFPELLDRAEQQRLLRINTLRIGGDKEQRYVSLGHDALAKVAAGWDEEFTRFERTKKFVVSLAVAGTLVVILSGLSIGAMSGWSAAAKNQGIAEENLLDAKKNLLIARKNEDLTVASIQRVITTADESRAGVKALQTEIYQQSQRELETLVKNWNLLGEPADIDTQRNHARARYSMGKLKLLLLDPNGAIVDFDRAAKIQQVLHKMPQAELDVATRWEVVKELSDTWTGLGNARRRIEDTKPKAEQQWNQAIEAHDNARSLRESLLKKNEGPENFRLLANSLANLGLCQWKKALATDDLKAVEVARATLDVAISMCDQAVDRSVGESLVEAEKSLGIAYQNLAELEKALGNVEAMEANYRRALCHYALGVQEQESECVENSARCHNLLANGAARRQDYQSAREEYEAANKLYGALIDGQGESHFDRQWGKIQPILTWLRENHPPVTASP